MFTHTKKFFMCTYLFNTFCFVINKNSIKQIVTKKLLLLSISALTILSPLIVYNFFNGHVAWGHSILGSNNKNGTQIQQNGNYKVELFLNPSKPILNKDTSIFLRFTSSAGDDLIELPISLSIYKDGQVKNSSNNYMIVQKGHYNFNYTFKEQGKYLLFVNIKDIFYTQNVLNFIFEINVDVPIAEKFFGVLNMFFLNYYYVYIPMIIISLSYLILRSKKYKIKIKRGVR